MDTPQKSSGLTSIRTFAKDLEMKKQVGTPTKSSETTPVPIPEVTMVTSESNVYQAPKWKKRKTGPTEETKVPKSPEKPPAPEPTPEPTLKPLSSPKSASEPTIIVDNEDAASATIIRDTKHNRFRLFPAIGTSLQQWITDLKEKYFTKKAPKYTVPETSLRKGVIQKATSKTGKMATFDYGNLHERIRDRKDRVAPKTPSTTWTANTEPGFPLLEEGEGVTNVQVEPRKSFRAVTPTPAPVVPTPVQKPTPVVEPTPAPVTVTPPPVTPPLPETEPEPTPVLATTVPVVEEVTQPNTTQIPEPTFRDWLFSINTNLMSLGVTGLVVALITVSTIGFLWFRSELSNSPLIPAPDHPSLLNVPLTLLYVNELSYENLPTKIIEELARREAGLVQLGVVATQEGTTLLPVPAILKAMDFDVSAVFGRSISTLYFGRLEDGTPFIIFKTTDSTTAKGGMLAWENSLYTDTLPILGHNAQNRNLPTTAVFTDTIIADTDARVLIGEDGAEFVAYSLTKDNVVLITTGNRALTELFTVIE